MSMFRLNKVAVPATPAAGKCLIFEDTADFRAKQLDENGVLNVLNPDGWDDKNILINGGQEFCQRVATALTNITSPSTTNRVYCADRWGFTVGNATTPQYQQVDTNGAVESGITARFYSRYKQLTNAAKMAVTQVVEGRDAQPLRGLVVRFQVKARYSVGANRTMRLGLINNTGTVDAPTAGWISAFGADGTDPTLGASLAFITPTLVDNGSIVGTSMNFTLTSSWQRFSATFLVPTSCLNLMPVIFNNAAGSANDDLLLTEMGLYQGQMIRDWVAFPSPQEMIRCLRFYCKTFDIGTVPAAAVSSGKIQWGAGVAGASAGAWGGWRFPVPMVKAPAVTLFNPVTGGSAQVRQLSATAGDCTASSATSITTQSCEFTTTPGASAVIGSILGVQATADADL